MTRSNSPFPPTAEIQTETLLEMPHRHRVLARSGRLSPPRSPIRRERVASILGDRGSVLFMRPLAAALERRSICSRFIPPAALSASLRIGRVFTKAPAHFLQLT